MVLRRAVFSLAALALAVGGAWVLLRRGPGSRAVRETAREVLLAPEAWTVVASAPGAPPHVGVITPTLDWSLDGGDLAALVMPPPCEVRFEVPPGDGPAFLRASAGLGRLAVWQLKDAPEDCSVLFEIEIDGENRFTARAFGRAPPLTRTWHHAGGRRGIPVEPGDVVTLRTTLSHPDAPIFGELGIQAGFGRLEIEREVERPYARASARDPNVVLVVMDTLRADELSCYGATDHATPALDALGARGILYEQAYATSSWTWPSTASILTGRPPEAHGVLDEAACYLDGDLETIAEVLLDRGLATGAFVCNPLLDPAKNFDQGFETYDYSRDFRMSGAVVDGVRRWLEERRDVRFFLYLHLVDPHHPVLARPEDFARIGIPASPPPGSPEQPLIEYARRLVEDRSCVAEGGRVDPDRIVPAEHQEWMRKAYCASVLSADHFTGRILDALAEAGLEDDTIVVFTSDHGEELFDHGMLGHGKTLHQELVRVPLLVAGPGVPRGTRVATPVSNQSLFRTIADRCGATASAVPADVDLLDPARVAARPLHFTTETGWWWNEPRTAIHGVLDWPWVLHAAPRALPWGAAAGADPGPGQVRLYDLERDPGERSDRSGERGELAAELKARLEEHARSSTRERDARPGSGEGTRDLLRRIGYTGDEK